MMTHFARRLTTFSLLMSLLLGSLAVAQDRRPSTVTPEELQRVSGWFKTIQKSQVDPKLLNSLKELIQANPQLKDKPGELAKKFLAKNPELLQDPNKLAQLQQLAQQINSGTAGSDLVPGQDMPSWITPPSTVAPPASVTPPDVTTPPDRATAEMPSTPPTPGPPHNPPPTADPQQVQNFPTPPPPPPLPPPMPAGNGRTPSGLKVPPPIILGPPPNQQPPVPSNPYANNRDYQRVAGWWEQNIGSLKDSPGVQQMIAEFVMGASAEGDKNWLNQLFKGNDPTRGMNSETLTKISDSLSQNPISLPNVGLSSLGDGWGKSIGNWAAPRRGLGEIPDVGSFGHGSSWMPVLGVLALALAALALWWFWPMLNGSSPPDARDQPQHLGPWPIHPREIRDRESLILAFEYLSVLLCGHAARTWNHLVIAEKLRERVPGREMLAQPLAEIYAVARYTPHDQPLPAGVMEDARVKLCQLAGVKP